MNILYQSFHLVQTNKSINFRTIFLEINYGYMGDNRLLKVVLGHEFQIQSPKYESHPIVVATSIAPFTFNGIPWEK